MGISRASTKWWVLLFWRLRGSAANPVQAGWLGKGKDESSSSRSEHVSQPLSSLRDPASFAPPPKRYGSSPAPNPTPPQHNVGTQPARAQNYTQNIHHQQATEAEEAASKPAPPPVPYRVNTTGLSTDSLPPPPTRRLDSPSSASATSSRPTPPQPPPRLPARNDSSTHTPPPPPYAAAAPSPYPEYINQGAASNLSNAGVSVPSLGIGGKDNSSSSSTGGGAADKLQNRFSQMRTNSGTTFTAPAGVDSSLPPPPTFRERHADKIDMGKQKLGGVTSRFNTFVEDRKFSANANKRIPRPPGPNSPTPASPARASPAASAPATTPDVQAQAQRKKPPPPPPPKRAEIRAPPANASPMSSSSPAPPPVPLNTKPR